MYYRLKKKENFNARARSESARNDARANTETPGKRLVRANADENYPFLSFSVALNRQTSAHSRARGRRLSRDERGRKKEKSLDDAPASAARTLNAARGAGATLLFEDATEDVKTREETAEVDACNENDIVFVLAWVLRSGDFERERARVIFLRFCDSAKKTFRVCVFDVIP